MAWALRCWSCSSFRWCSSYCRWKGCADQGVGRWFVRTGRTHRIQARRLGLARRQAACQGSQLCNASRDRCHGYWSQWIGYYWLCFFSIKKLSCFDSLFFLDWFILFVRLVFKIVLLWFALRLLKSEKKILRKKNRTHSHLSIQANLLCFVSLVSSGRCTVVR